MAKTNALTEWLNIPADQQPANHYRLLNLKKFTSDVGKINTAAEKAIALVRRHAEGKNASVGKKLIGMIDAARDCLLDAKSKAAYDKKLRGAGTTALPEPVELNQVAQSDASAATSRAKKKSGAMLLPIIGGAIVPLAIYVFMFSGWFGGEEKNDENPGSELQVQDGGGGGPRTDDDKSQPVSVTSVEKTAVPSKTPDGKTLPPVKVAVKTPSKINGKKKTGGSPVSVKTSAKPAAGTVDLLKSIDPRRHKDRIDGTWTLKDGVLATPGSKYSRLVIAKEAPKEYELHLNVKRGASASSRWFGIALTGGGSQFWVFFDQDHRGELVSGLAMLDGKPVFANETTRKTAVFKPGVESHVVCQVHSKGVKVTVDGWTIIDWTGAFTRLAPHRSLPLRGPKQLGISAGSSFGLSKIELRPIQTINLLKKVDPKRDIFGGRWALENGVLSTTSTNPQGSYLVIAREAPKEYELRFTVTRTGTLKQASWFGFILSGGGRMFSAALDHPPGWTSGLQMLDGKLATQNETSRQAGSAPLLKIGVESQIVCRVDSRGVKVIVDGKPVINWHGDFSRLSPHPSLPRKTSKHLRIATASPFKISKIELRPLGDSPAAPTTTVVKKSTAKRQLGRFAAIRIPGVKPALHKKDSTVWLRVKYDKNSLPKFMGTGFEYLSGGHKSANTTHFEVLSDGVVHMVLSGRPGGGGGRGAWSAGVTTPAQIAKAGWKPVGKMDHPRHPQNVIYERFCKKGESFTLSWEKYIRPGLILPDPSYKKATPLPIPENRLAVPDAAAQKKALALVKEIFKKDFLAAKTPGVKLELAEKLLEQAKSSGDDAAAQFVLMLEARDLAVDAGDPSTAMSIIDAIVQVFEIDLFAQQRDALRKLARTVRITPRNLSMVNTALDAAKAALKARQFDVSLDLARIAGTAATKTRNRGLIKRISDFRKDMLMMKKWHEEAAKAEKTLATSPDDPDANLARGRYLCLIEGNWAAGLPMLAKGKDTALQAAAKQDIATPTDTKPMVALAEAWWNLPQKHKGDSFQKAMFADRAGHWYGMVAPNLMGLEKTRIEKRMQELDELPDIVRDFRGNVAATSSTAPKKTVAKKGVAKTTARRVVAVWEISSFDRRTDRIAFFSDGKTNNGHPWVNDGKKFSFGYDSGGTVTADGLRSVGKWQRGGVYTARLLMKDATLQSVPAKKTVMPESFGSTPFGTMPSGDLDETTADAWEFLAATRGGKNLIRLTVDLTADHQVLDGSRRIGSWKVDKRRTIVKFLDDKFGEVSFGMRNRNELTGRAVSQEGVRWDCALTRIQKVAVFKKNDGKAKLTFYSNGRVNSIRAAKGQGYFWTLTLDSAGNRKIAFARFSSTVSKDGRSFSGRGPYGARVKGELLSGSLLRK